MAGEIPEWRHSLADGRGFGNSGQRSNGSAWRDRGPTQAVTADAQPQVAQETAVAAAVSSEQQQAETYEPARTAAAARTADAQLQLIALLAAYQQTQSETNAGERPAGFEELDEFSPSDYSVDEQSQFAQETAVAADTAGAEAFQLGLIPETAVAARELCNIIESELALQVIPLSPFQERWQDGSDAEALTAGADLGSSRSGRTILCAHGVFQHACIVLV